MSERLWLRSRTPNGRWFDIRWDKDPTGEDIDHMLAVLAVTRSGYTTMNPPRDVFGIRLVRLGDPRQEAHLAEEATP